MSGPVSRGAARRLVLTVAALALSLSGCGSHFVVLHPAGPVARRELHVVAIAAVAMGAIILLVVGLLAATVLRFRDRPGRRAAYAPDWEGSRGLEVLWFAIPLVIVAIIAVPTVRTTFALDRLPTKANPVVVDVTSLNWKWLFEYPREHVATVGYIEVPVGRPILFELTADGPMNTFWIPALGGMEYTMPGRLLPLWLQADKPGLYWGRSGNFSGTGFVHMQFQVRAVSASRFTAWTSAVRATAPPMSMAEYRSLLKFSVVGRETYSGYPAGSFPSATHGFTLQGGMYSPGGM